ncbi:calmodulin-binding protein 25-like [Hordeum vulgare subsp. vulgare]|uniref:Predicted protein n=1 Tax=Hordeum vulgare subsp. vulgare TaxID=112509 RepID=F2D639_HORVV|nr:calmodulin-binding protein 25-like [Hordeum vulgare subsp. vulgare]KAI4994351.1 hypothetical protein ZWY2020_029399 [Hordeum vulgare]KAI4994355.1 hypothetical protein ZWY2020_029403 [Hordeum vulgare]BAJ90560.1 predicted protein [Hordeum vulgare subsp. vulgare]
MDAVSCFAPPALLSRSFADAAIARALHFSLSAGSSFLPEPSIIADLGACCAEAMTAPTSSCSNMAMLPPAAAAARCRLGPAGGRAGKRRPRPSKRVPTTYISTDAATFRLMVQHVTGAEAEPQVDADASLGVLLSPFDFDHLLPLDPAAAAAQVAAYALPAAPAAEQPCFPTLDSSNVMYDKN